LSTYLLWYLKLYKYSFISDCYKIFKLYVKIT
jgi:hypothetical protein